MYAQDNNSLPAWIILSPAHHHISINSQPFLVGIVSNNYTIDHVSGQSINACLISEKQRAMESLLFPTENRDKMIKSSHCATGSTQCAYMECDEVMSLTISTEGTLLTAVIEAQEGCDITTCDIPNAFVQTHVDEKNKDGN